MSLEEYDAKELVEEIERLRKENLCFRAMLDRKEHRTGYPDKLLSEFPFVMEAVGINPTYHSHHTLFLNEWFSQKLSAVIRSTVFADTKIQGKRNVRFISIQDMNDEEYQLWLDVLESVLDALDSGIQRRKKML